MSYRTATSIDMNHRTTQQYSVPQCYKKLWERIPILKQNVFLWHTPQQEVIMEFIKETNRLYAENDSGKLLAEITFPFLSETLLCIDHTFVDPSLRGQGIGEQLIKQVIVIAEETGKQIKPQCSYAVSWFEKHPEHAHLVIH